MWSKLLRPLAPPATTCRRGWTKEKPPCAPCWKSLLTKTCHLKSHGMSVAWRAKLVTRLRKPWKAKGLCRTRLPSTIRKVASIMFWLPSILAKQPRTIQLEPTLFKLNSGGGRAPSKQQRNRWLEGLPQDLFCRRAQAHGGHHRARWVRPCADETLDGEWIVTSGPAVGDGRSVFFDQGREVCT
jgi:hypothetical protein